MIIQTLIFRSDSLPLSTSTDVDNRASVKDCQKYIKLVSKRLQKLPDRCVLDLEQFKIHLKSGNDVTILLLCEDSYPHVLAVSYLDEVAQEFFDSFGAKQIANAKRPYAFVSFDSALQKLRQKYNNPRSLTTRVNLSVLSNELRFRPPYQITEFDLDLASNGLARAFRDTSRPTVNPERRFIPMNWFGMLSVSLNLFAAALNLIRGMSVIGHGLIDEMDTGAYGHGSAFLLLSALFCGQVYLMFFFTPWRHLQTALLLIGQFGCSYYVLSFRNVVQTTFFMIVTLFATVVILTRRQTSKLPGYSV